MLFAPDTLRVDLAGQAAAPGVDGACVHEPADSGMAFAANQLPALPADKVYQLWVVPQNAAPVSAGLLAPDASGHASLFFPMPADRDGAAGPGGDGRARRRRAGTHGRPAVLLGDRASVGDRPG